jgi:orotate phosphoribosyltransferase
MGNMIEGVLEPGQKVVVIEDLVSTGKSSLQVVDAIREAGGEVMGMCALFTYGFPAAAEAFEKSNVSLHTISNYQALMEVGEEQKLIAADQKEVLESWRLDPANWGK